jgi:Fe-S-cluster containining protein
MGKDTVKFSCHHCNHCCTEVVCLPTPWDVRRIMKMTGEAPEDFIEFLTPVEIDEVDMDDPTWLEVNGEHYMMALQRDEKTGCHFLDNKTTYCSIYEARPLLCRLYPFEMQEDKDGNFKGFGLHKDVGCPKHTDDVYQVKPLYDLAMQDELNQEDYCELVDIFNNKKYKNKIPWDFITMFTGGLTNFDEAMEPASTKK